MPAKVVWLDQAQDDVKSISDYIAGDNPAAAARYVEKIFASSAKLGRFPLSGRKYDALFRTFASWSSTST